MLNILFGFSITSYIFGAVVIFISKWYWDRYFWGKRLPPGPPTLPFLGSLPFLPDKDLSIMLAKMSQKYGDMFMMDLGLQRCLVISRYDLVKEALVKHGDVFLERPNKFMGIRPHKKFGVGMSAGQEWQDQKRFIHQCLRDFGFGSKTTMEDAIRDEVCAMREIIEAQQNAFDPSIIFSNGALNVMSSFISGKRLDYTDPVFTNLLDIVNRISELMDRNNLASCYPFLRHVPWISSTMVELEIALLALKSFVNTWIEDMKCNYSADNEPSSFIEAFASEIEKHKSIGSTGFTDDHLAWTVVDMVYGGTDTSAVTLTWTVVYVINNPDVQRKIHNEISSVLGTERLPTLRDRPNLPYCDAVIHEVLRISGIVPSPLPRITTEDTNFNGYFIPKGTSVMQNLNGIHLNPKDWDEPTKFNPDRFLDENGKFKRQPQMIAFSLGKRNCVGESLARAELFLFFVGLLQKFKLEADGQAPRPTEKIPGLITHPRPFKITAKPRE